MTSEKEIRVLLEKYFEGETTSAEEMLLREYFSQAQHVADDLLYAQAMFGFFSDAAGQGGRKLDMTAIADTPEKLNPDMEREGASISLPERRARRRILQAVSWAAVIVVVMSIGLTVFNTHEEDLQPTIYCYVNGEPVTDLDMAIAYTEQTMELIGGTLRKPMQYLAPLQEFERAMQKLEYLSLLTQHFEGQDTNGTN